MTDTELVQVTWLRAFKVWWSLLWRGLLFSFLAAAGVGFVLGSFMELVKLEPEIIKTVCLIVGYIVSIPVGIAVTKSVLKNQYSDFRIGLLAK
jgi:hypothetical protein